MKPDQASAALVCVPAEQAAHERVIRELGDRVAEGYRVVTVFFYGAAVAVTLDASLRGYWRDALRADTRLLVCETALTRRQLPAELPEGFAPGALGAFIDSWHELAKVWSWR